MGARDLNYPMTQPRTDQSTAPVDEIVSNRRRRYLLYCLCLYANPMRLPDIADQVTVWEHTGLPENYERERLHVYNSLYHDHLPVLCGADLTEYHQVEDMVELGPAAEHVESTLEAEFGREVDDLLAAEGQSMAHDE